MKLANVVWCAGEKLELLVSWLKAASIEREAGLLKALSQAPLPKKVPVEGDPLTACDLAQMNAAWQAHIATSSAGKCAPMSCPLGVSQD